jgi:hypothetical protein
MMDRGAWTSRWDWHVDRFGAATNSSRIDAKREDNFLQADLWTGITSGCGVIRELSDRFRQADLALMMPRSKPDGLQLVDFAGVGTREQNVLTLNRFVRLAEIFERSASLIR